MPSSDVPPTDVTDREEVTPRRWRKPVLVAGLTLVLVIVAVAVRPAITGRATGAAEPPAAPACPTGPAVEPVKFLQQTYPGSQTAVDKLPFGPPPKVPFIMTKDGAGYLEDQGVRVPLPPGYRFTVLGRTTCGWVLLRSKDDKLFETGVLGTAGGYRSIGLIAGHEVALSPDGAQLAYHDRTGPIVVAEVATGQKVASQPADLEARLDGWNPDGIWFVPNKRRPELRLWRPGTPPVAIQLNSWGLSVNRANRLVTYDVSSGMNPCFEIAALEEATRLRGLRKTCGTVGGWLSPDDKLAVTFSGSTRAFSVDSGEPTPLDFPEPVGSDAPGLVWEDATHILGSTWLSKNREATLRCNVVSGACERIQDGPRRTGPTLGFP